MNRMEWTPPTEEKKQKTKKIKCRNGVQFIQAISQSSEQTIRQAVSLLDREPCRDCDRDCYTMSKEQVKACINSVCPDDDHEGYCRIIQQWN